MCHTNLHDTPVFAIYMAEHALLLSLNVRIIISIIKSGMSRVQRTVLLLCCRSSATSCVSTRKRHQQHVSLHYVTQIVVYLSC